MRVPTDTQEKIQKITEAGRFERLATKVLKLADSSYASLVHTGVNAKLQTVKSPVDGITVTLLKNKKHLILVHHTITSKTKLREKWLSSEDSDFNKAYEIFKKEKKERRIKDATLILTASHEPSESLIRDLHAKATNGFKLDIWSGSRIADFLDHDAEGQWVRKIEFGTAQERLSSSLLREICSRSWANHLAYVPFETIVPRKLDNELSAFVENLDGVGFVFGESGTGKSVACRKLGSERNARQQPTLLLPHSIVENSFTLAQALNTYLPVLSNGLDPSCGAEALKLDGDNNPITIIIEDVNLSGKPSAILTKLVEWGSTNNPPQQDGNGSKKGWKIVCPLWRKTTDPVDRHIRAKIFDQALHAEIFDRRESLTAIRSYSNKAGFNLSKAEMNECAETLGDDPLLIALNSDWKNPSASTALHDYIASQIEKLADSSLLRSDLSLALTKFIDAAISKRRLYPTWEEVSQWFSGEPDTQKSLRRILDAQSIIRLDKYDDGWQVGYRHDRVRDHLVVNSLQRAIKANTLSDDILADPFFADHLGQVLAGSSAVESSLVDTLAETNPAVIFAALRTVGDNQHLQKQLVNAAISYLEKPEINEPSHEALKFQILNELARTDGDFVLPMLSNIKKGGWPILGAAFRNGSVKAGASICSGDFGGAFPWRDNLIDHYVQQGYQYVDALGGLISHKGTSNELIEGALILAGEIGDPALAPVIRLAKAKLGEISPGLLWAALRCSLENDKEYVDEIVEMWAALPEEINKEPVDRHPRADLVYYNIKWAVARKPKPEITEYIINIANSDERLRWPATIVLKQIDEPAAVEFIAHEMAETDKRVRKSKEINLMGTDIDRIWDASDHGRQMSATSRDTLKKIWSKKRNSAFLRRAAFRMWKSGLKQEDLKQVRSLATDKVLQERALSARLKFGDQTAAELLTAKITSGKKYAANWWYHARDIGLDNLKDAVSYQIATRNNDIEQKHKVDGYHSDWVLSKLLADRRDQYSVKLLETHWGNFKDSPQYVQAALYLASPVLTKMAQDAILSAPQPKILLEHLDGGWGYKEFGRPGIVAIEQLESLEPLIEHLSDFTVTRLFDACNELGFHDWRRKFIDERYFSQKELPMDDEERLIHALNQRENDERYMSSFMDHWIGDFLKEGWSLNKLYQSIAKWSAKKGTDSSVKLLALSLQEEGTRDDLPLLLMTGISSSENAKACILNCEYTVKRRSLI